jgi:hypothetical protein
VTRLSVFEPNQSRSLFRTTTHHAAPSGLRGPKSPQGAQRTDLPRAAAVLHGIDPVLCLHFLAYLSLLLLGSSTPSRFNGTNVIQTSLGHAPVVRPAAVARVFTLKRLSGPRVCVLIRPFGVPLAVEALCRAG